MSIRIAEGAPTEPGNYLCRHAFGRWGRPSNVWEGCLILDRGTKSRGPNLWAKRNGKLQPLAPMIRAGWEFSTRIPDPVTISREDWDRRVRESEAWQAVRGLSLALHRHDELVSEIIKQIDRLEGPAEENI